MFEQISISIGALMEAVKTAFNAMVTKVKTWTTRGEPAPDAGPAAGATAGAEGAPNCNAVPETESAEEQPKAKAKAQEEGFWSKFSRNMKKATASILGVVGLPYKYFRDLSIWLSSLVSRNPHIQSIIVLLIYVAACMASVTVNWVLFISALAYTISEIMKRVILFDELKASMHAEFSAA